MRSKILIPITIGCIFASCSSSNPPEEILKPTIYNSKEIGWTIEIPAGYKLISKAKIEVNDQKGKEAIGEVYDGEVTADSLQHLASFQKNQLNIFDSTIERYEEKELGEYEKNNQELKKLIFDTYSKQKIKADTSSGKETIQGHVFHAFYIKVYGPNGTPLMSQIMYATLINGYDFGVNINYNNEIDKNLLINAFKKSKFDK